jgi:hypothetical protein
MARLQQSLPAPSASLSKLSITEAMGNLGENSEGQYVIPVYKVDRDCERVSRLMQSDCDFWFYADNKPSFEVVDGEVWLADFELSDWYHLQNSYEHAGRIFRRQDRRLSKAAKETKAGGSNLSSMNTEQVFSAGKADTLKGAVDLAYFQTVL